MAPSYARWEAISRRLGGSMRANAQTPGALIGDAFEGF